MLGWGGWVKTTKVTHFFYKSTILGMSESGVNCGENSSQAGRWKVYGGRIWVGVRKY